MSGDKPGYEPTVSSRHAVIPVRAHGSHKSSRSAGRVSVDTQPSRVVDGIPPPYAALTSLGMEGQPQLGLNEPAVISIVGPEAGPGGSVDDWLPRATRGYEQVRNLISTTAQGQLGIVYLSAYCVSPPELAISIYAPEPVIPLGQVLGVGRVLREGVNVLILGRPNVGKSSLMNAILGESRAIVNEFAGTTRDTLEEQLVLAGFPVRLVDAAGVRDTDDPVEQEGVRRAREKAAAADLVLMVVDGSSPLTDQDLLALELCQPDKTLVVVNKSDQAQNCELERLAGFPCQVAVSAKYSLGLDDLSAAILELLKSDTVSSGSEGVVVTERRHREALLLAGAALKQLMMSAAESAPLECLATDLREALSSLGLITGETTPDEILDQIFSQFCVGK